VSRRAPKKFTDATQSEITQEWREWYDQMILESQDEMEAIVMGLGEHPENRWPEQYDKDLGDGRWIFVVEEPSTELRSRFRIPTPSLWWARPEGSRPGGMNFGTRQRPLAIPGPYRAVIETPGGSLWLFPQEYVVCDNPLPLITDPECTIHSLGGRPALDEEKLEQMFYLQSRGWSYQDALLALMDGVDMRDWGWVEFPEYAREMFEGVGRRLVLR
jgi:hypothetical protein